MPEVLTPKQVADLLGVSTDSLARWRVLGTGPKFIKLGRSQANLIRYRRSEIDRYLTANEQKSTSDR
jgi:predicted DNA-binding transcriptional regulator AlpA